MVKFANFIQISKLTQDEFEKFIDNLELNLETLCQNNPFVILLIGDLSAKSKNWYSHDKTSHEGNEIENVTAQFGLQQIIKRPNTSSFCIDLIFTSQPNLITDSGVNSSLHPDLIYCLKFLQEHLSTTIASLKERYYARIANRLKNTKKSSKTFWYLLKIFLNNKKILPISPLFS